MADMNFAESEQILNAVKVLEGLERDGTITAGEKRALDKYRAKQGDARQESAEGRAQYRGFQKGLTFNALDEASGAVAAMTGGDYAGARDAVRMKDQAAELVAPDAFATGQMAGGVATAAIPSVGVLRATQGLRLAGKAAYGGVAGGLLGGAMGFMDGEGGFMNRLDSAKVPAAVGAAAGVVAPLLGYGAGRMVRGAQDATRGIPGVANALATQTMARALHKSQGAGTDIRAYLDSLGPEGMLADIPGNPRKIAQGLGAMPGAGGEQMATAIEGRAATSGARIRADADAVIGGPDDAFAERARLAAERRNKLGPEYEAALAAPGPITVDGIARDILEMQKDAAGGVSSSLRKVQSELGFTIDALPNGGTRLKADPVSAAKLHNVRSELSDDIDEAQRAGRGKFVAQMKPVLERIDQELDKIPGYQDARTGYANNKAMDRALDDGRAVFRGGEASALSPSALRDKIKGLSPAQLDAFRKGAREYVDALMGTARNDAAAAWGQFAKDWNEEKLRIVLGKADGDRLINRLRAENIFSATRGDVLKGSQTQMRAEAANDLADFRDPDTGRQPGPVARAARAVNTAGNAAIDAVMYGPRRQAANEQLGGLLSMTGPRRDQVLPALMGEAARQGLTTRPQMAARGLLDILTRSSFPMVAPLIGGNVGQ